MTFARELSQIAAAVTVDTDKNVSIPKNLTFTGTGNRILGDFSNATIANRVAFQTSTTNANTAITVLPSGTGAGGYIVASNNSDPTNAGVTWISATSTESSLYAHRNGSGTYLPLTMYTNGSERLRIDTSGNVGIGTTSPAYRLDVRSATAIINLEPTTATDGTYFRTANTGGYLFVGRDSSTGNSFGTAYAAVIASSGAYPMTFFTNATERMRIDSNGSLLVAATSTANAINKLQVGSGSADTRAVFNPNNAYAVGLRNGANDAGWIGANGANTMVFSNSAGTERMRINSSGNLLVGTTATNPRDFTSGSGFAVNTPNGTLEYASSDSNVSFINYTGSASGSGTFFTFRQQAVTRGSISTNGTITIYNTTSDYRLKNVVGDISDAGTRIDALEPIEYDWNTGGRTRGFLAHKFAEVYPNSVHGEKDAVDEKGNPVYQGMQAATSEVMADLIAEIQSLRKRVAQLESN
jgi:hypothetical protein